MRKLSTIFMLLLFMVAANSAKASHLMGSDITYKCLGNGLYEVTVTVYRDCNGIQISNSPLQAKCAPGSGTGQTSFNLPEVQVNDVTGIGTNCPVSSRCSGTYDYGIEEHIYKGIIDLSSLNCCEIILSWQQSARNGAITTGASNQNFYTEAIVNKCVTPCNSSPKFTSPPTALICVGQDFEFNNGASDTIDVGDSLSYKLVQPLSFENTPIAYSAPWSATKPITFLGFPNAGLNRPAGLHFDSATGDLAFRPTVQNQVTVLVIEVTEWRKINGVMTKIGVTRRDMQIIVIPCPDNKAPTIQGKSEVACAGQQKCIDITTNDPDADDTVKISWNKGIPRAVFSHTNGTKRLATGSVCWTPTDNDVSTVPYTFTITAKDDACPKYGQSIRAFSITVKESPKADRHINKLTCGRTAVNYTPFKTYPGLTHEWLVKDSLNRNIAISNKKIDTLRLQPGWNRVFLTLKTATCINAFVDSVWIDPYVTVTLPNDTIICAGNPMTLKSTTKYGVAPFRYSWNTGDSVTQVVVNPGKDSAFWINITDAAGCVNSDTVKVKWRALPVVNVGPDKRICYDNVHTMEATADSTANKNKYKFLWSTGDTSRIVTVKDSGAYIATIRDSVGCRNFDTMNLMVNTVPVDIGSNQFVCIGDTAFFTAVGADTYDWYVMPSASPSASGASFFLRITGDRQVAVKATRTYDFVTCTNYDTADIKMNALPDIKFAPVAARCANDGPFALSFEALAAPTITSGTWTGVTKPSTVNNNQFYPDSASVPIGGTGTFTVRYFVTDGNGCKNTATTTVPVNGLPPARVADASYCSYDGRKNLATLMDPATTFTPGTKTWTVVEPDGQAGLVQQGNNYFFDLSLVPEKATYTLILRHVQSLAPNCTNYDTALITVREVPEVEAGYIAPLCQNDAAINLDSKASPSPAGGTWSIAPGFSGFTAPNGFDPDQADSAFSYNKLYYTYDIPGNNCPAKDSLDLLVKPRPNTIIQPITNVCQDKGIYDLNVFANPKGGQWTGDGGVTAGGVFNTQTAGPGQYVFQYKYTDFSTGCSHQATGGLFVQEKPVLTLTIPKSACEGLPYNLASTSTVNTGVLWTRTVGDGTFDNGQPTTTANNPVYTPGPQDNAKPGFSLTVETTNTGACAVEKHSVDIDINPNPTASIVGAPEGCEPLPTSFTGVSNQDPDVTYEWNFGDPNSPDNIAGDKTVTHTFNKYGLYNVTMKVKNNNTGCEGIATAVPVTVHATPTADFIMSREVTTVAATDISFTNRSAIAQGTINKYEWEFGDPAGTTSSQWNPKFEYPTDTGLYIITLKVISDKLCEAVHTDTLLINPDITVFIPNAFTPNLYGPGKNNRFYVHAEGFLSFEIGIFNRWGERMYNSTSIEEGWDGTFKGEPVQQDVYMYVVNVTSFAGKPYKFTGTITLMR